MLLRTVLRSLGSWVAAILLLLSLALAPSRSLASSEQLSPGPQMLHSRAAHTATTLADGRVFIAGGCTADSCDLTADGATTEIFVPAQNAFVTGPVLGTPRVSHAALRLPDGRVLLIGGWTPDGPAASTEMFDPATNTVSPGRRWAARGQMPSWRSWRTARCSSLADTMVSQRSPARRCTTQ